MSNYVAFPPSKDLDKCYKWFLSSNSIYDKTRVTVNAKLSDGIRHKTRVDQVANMAVSQLEISYCKNNSVECRLVRNYPDDLFNLIRDVLYKCTTESKFYK